MIPDAWTLRRWTKRAAAVVGLLWLLSEVVERAEEAGRNRARVAVEIHELEHHHEDQTDERD